MDQPGRTEPGLLRRWTVATAVGWILGIPIVIVLALAGEAVGIAGAQVLVGAGMGAGIGLGQRRIIHTMLGRSGGWIIACIAGLSIPFLPGDLARALGRAFPYSLPVAVAVGGLVVGAWQARLLRTRLHGAGWWTVASAIGWALASSMVAAADGLFGAGSVRGLWGAALYLGTIAGGGVGLGLATGSSLTLMRPRTP